MKTILSFLVSSDTEYQVRMYIRMSVHRWINGFTGGRTNERMHNLIDGFIYGLFDEILEDR